MMKNVHFYLRVSTKGQENPSAGTNGATGQRFELEKYANQRRVHIASEECDKLSGWKDSVRQVGLERIISRLQPGDVIYVIEPDRFCRNVTKAQAFLRRIHMKGASVFSIRQGLSSHQDSFMQGIVYGEMDSDRRSRQMKASWARKKAGVSNVDEEYSEDSSSSESIESEESESESTSCVVSKSSPMEIDSSDSSESEWLKEGDDQIDEEKYRNAYLGRESRKRLHHLISQNELDDSSSSDEVEVRQKKRKASMFGWFF